MERTQLRISLYGLSVINHLSGVYSCKYVDGAT